MALRIAFLLLVLVSLPVIATPAVGNWLESVVHGEQLSSPSVDQFAQTGAKSPVGNSPIGQTSTAYKPLQVSSVDSIGSDRFREIQQRLQELGATYLLLESYGSDRPSYRFYCRMEHELAGHSFESTDPDVLQAMERLLRQVEYWVATNSPAAG